jgi:hypothetical protein
MSATSISKIFSNEFSIIFLTKPTQDSDSIEFYSDFIEGRFHWRFSPKFSNDEPSFKQFKFENYDPVDNESLDTEQIQFNRDLEEHFSNKTAFSYFEKTEPSLDQIPQNDFSTKKVCVSIQPSNQQTTSFRQVIESMGLFQQTFQSENIIDKDLGKISEKF